MINELKENLKSKMLDALDSTKKQINKIRTGRANTSLIDGVMVSYYGSMSPILSVANLSIEDSRTIKVSVFDKSMVGAVEKAIINADLGLNPSTDGNIIRITIPLLTEDRRKELIKSVRGKAENGRISIRNIRREANNEIKSLLKNKIITEDELRKESDSIQKLTDSHIKSIDVFLSAKEKELMTV